MSSTKFLDINGLNYVWNKMKNYVDSKSSSGGETKVLSYNVSNVEAGTTRVTPVSNEQLAASGVSDMNDYEIIGASVYISEDTLTVYGAHDVSGSFVVPNIVYQANSGLQITIKNIYDATKNFVVQLVLMKVQ